MLSLHHLFPEVARAETRTLTVNETDELPAGGYTLLEHYCADPACDCQRVLLLAMDASCGEAAAVISHAFSPPADGSPQTLLDPRHRQSAAAPALLRLFVDTLDEAYAARLRRHYASVKGAGADLGPTAARGRLSFRLPQTVRRDGPRPGRNDPCPCGSGRKVKRCCAGQPLDARERPAP